jgi:hypothetical protein
MRTNLRAKFVTKKRESGKRTAGYFILLCHGMLSILLRFYYIRISSFDVEPPRNHTEVVWGQKPQNALHQRYGLMIWLRNSFWPKPSSQRQSVTDRSVHNILPSCFHVLTRTRMKYLYIIRPPTTYTQNMKIHICIPNMATCMTIWANFPALQENLVMSTAFYKPLSKLTLSRVTRASWSDPASEL